MPVCHSRHHDPPGRSAEIVVTVPWGSKGQSLRGVIKRKKKAIGWGSFPEIEANNEVNILLSGAVFALPHE
ncbi:hypothetical protein K1719_040266 [Acacia pycnantha]|nr:hypothetical protein K1719_040266 [Acacia pycnantha]